MANYGSYNNHEEYDDELEHKSWLRSAGEGLKNAGGSLYDTMYKNDKTKHKKSDVDTRQALADERLKNSQMRRQNQQKRDEDILNALAASISKFLSGDNRITSDEDRQIKDILRNTHYTEYIINDNGKSVIFISKSEPNKTIPLAQSSNKPDRISSQSRSKGFYAL